MQETDLKILADKASLIAKKTAESLKHFGSKTAQLMYAKQLMETKIQPSFTGKNVHKTMSNEEANKKINRALQEAKLKWQFATNPEKNKVIEMEKIISAGQEKIKKLYEDIIPVLKNTIN